MSWQCALWLNPMRSLLHSVRFVILIIRWITKTSLYVMIMCFMAKSHDITLEQCQICNFDHQLNNENWQNMSWQCALWLNPMRSLLNSVRFAILIISWIMKTSKICHGSVFFFLNPTRLLLNSVRFAILIISWKTKISLYVMIMCFMAKSHEITLEQCQICNFDHQLNNEN